jgi:ABC-2 type transport system permease protein
VLLVALVLVATCLGLAVMLAIVRLAGPRAARTVAQVTIALFGGAMVIASQVMRYGGAAAGRNGFGVAYAWARAHHFGQGGWVSLPGRAGFGDPLAAAAIIVVAIALFAGTGVLFERHFVAAFQQAGHYDNLRPRQRRAARAGMRARFSGSLARTMLGKEMALLRRNPQILATMLLRLVYLVPMMLVLLQRHGQGVVLPAMAFVGVFVTTQLTGDLAWLVISGEDTPDLLAVAPIAKAMIGRTKAIVAMTMAAPLLAAVAVGIGSRAPVLVLVVLPIGLAGSAAAASIQLRLERPSPRKAFGRRTRGASIAANLLVLLVALMLGGVSASASWWLTQQ